MYVRAELQRAGMERNLLEGIVLTGGGAFLNGMCDMAERVLNCQAGNGLAKGFGDWPEELNSPAWTTAAGLGAVFGEVEIASAAAAADARINGMGCSDESPDKAEIKARRQNGTRCVEIHDSRKKLRPRPEFASSAWAAAARTPSRAC